MTVLPASSPKSRARWFRVALAMATVAQLVMAVLAPYVEARAGRTAHAHVEEAGTSRHYAHTEALCATCAAQHLSGREAREQRLPPVPTWVARAVPAIQVVVVQPERHPTAPPRAPPISL